MNSKGHEILQDVLNAATQAKWDIGLSILPDPDCDPETDGYLKPGENARYLSVSNEGLRNEFVLNTLHNARLMAGSSNQGTRPSLVVIGITESGITFEDMNAT